MINRETGKDILGNFVSISKNIEILEKNIYNYILAKYGEDENNYLNVIYEVCDALKEKISLKDIQGYIKEGKIEWKNPNFENEMKIQYEKDEFMTNPFQVEEGVMQCNKCGSKKTYSYQKQVRAADEGFSTFCFCMNCSAKWRIN